MGQRRIFWFGMHKVLKTTELAQLRRLGYEVFNPAYISPIYDQSADRRVDSDQRTTLPPKVFQTLLSHNFFYTEIPPDIADLLNSYFDTIIVTINFVWLRPVLAVFKGQVIWRLYGQHFSMSELITGQGPEVWELFISRDNFSIVPFARESIETEQNWFLDLCAEIVPYQIPDDVFALSGTWQDHPHRQQIATSIPNIENPYYREAYDAFNASYPHRIFRIYGPQRTVPDDPRIVGGLERGEFLSRLRSSAGFLYNYRDAVCYLSPIEVMEIGGPVLYAPGSLLSKFYGQRTPGLVEDRMQAEARIRQLFRADPELIAEIVAAQDSVRSRYDRKVVIPIFDRVFTSLIGHTSAGVVALEKDRSLIRCGRMSPDLARRRFIVVLLHADGLFGYSKGRPYAFEGIPRVVDVIVDALVGHTDLCFMITCTEGSRAVAYDFFQQHIKTGRVELRVVALQGAPEGIHARHEKLWLVEDINRRADVVCTLVPHYYLFPEALLLTGAVTLYLPDYFPHLMPDAVFDISAEKDRENKEVGVAIASKASAILTNSDFTKNYLPAAGFVAPDETAKVIVAPLPLLGARRRGRLAREEERELQDRIAGRRFLFYPTANRPNKQMSFFLRLFAFMRLVHPDLAVVLTCELGSVPGVSEVAQNFDLHDHMVFMSRVGDDVLSWLYQHAAALCLTSTLEGNFPPQILEALSFGTPVVATRLPTITEALGGLADRLLLCGPLSLDDFRENLEVALSRRSHVTEQQVPVLKFLQERSSPETFCARLQDALLPAPLDVHRAA